MHVDKSRRNDESGRVNHTLRLTRNPPDFDNAIPLDRDIPVKPWIPRAVHNLPVADDKVEIGSGSRKKCRVE